MNEVALIIAHLFSFLEVERTLHFIFLRAYSVYSVILDFEAPLERNNHLRLTWICQAFNLEIKGKTLRTIAGHKQISTTKNIYIHPQRKKHC